ncbi:hypothetical protein NLX83_27720 [Allokutzneria sp. A3M-2-11 16]|uniref:hypothetical protein n=1 Tax=Allokutzneria sp. A3M-2-11 16 TaxID=2962043 RepID=UPI0020B667CD|nr:hypothetical protein [Allokutzneria sp. A3M-2-11 16]MCP3803070.1 hypothetical protein [Allokutzneria sp. A3M-2-11 16]
MNTESDALGRVLHAAVSDVDTPLGFAEAALRKGKQRRKRVRAAMVGTALAITAMVGGLVSSVPVWLADSENVTPASDPRLGRPTGGDLAGDAELLSQSRILWNRELKALLDRLLSNAPAGCWDALGEPHVYWSGRTGAGPASVVMQAIRTTDSCFAHIARGEFTAVGLIGTDSTGKGVHLLGVTLKGAANSEEEVFLFGPDDNTVVALQESGARYYSRRAEVQADGKVTRDWHALSYRDGVATVVIPPAEPRPQPQNDPAFAKRTQAQPGATVPPEDRVRPFSTARSRGMVTGHGNVGYFGWLNLQGHLGGPRLEFAERLRRFNDVLDRMGYSDPAFRGAARARPGELTLIPMAPAGRQGESPSTLQGVTPGLAGGWHVTAVLPDGRTVIVGEEPINNSVHTYAVLWRGDVVDQVIHGAPAERDPVLPVNIRMPDGQGWIVARQGAKLKWRSTTGVWTDLPGDAALLPADAEMVNVTAPGIPSTNVTLGT